MIRKPQTVANVIIGFTLVNSTGGNATGEAANITTAITTPSGVALAGYTAPTITETSHAGNYIAVFSSSAANKAFTVADSANPYHISFDSPTSGVDPTGIIEVEIGTQLVETDTAVDGLVSAISALTALVGTPAGASLAADIATRLATSGYTAPDNASVATILSRVGGNVALDATVAKAAAVAAIPTVPPPTAAQILTTTLTESYASTGSAPTLAQILCMIFSLLGETSISGATLIARRLDGVTPAMAYTLNDATAPTSKTRTS